jgi:hypothetical protein
MREAAAVEGGACWAVLGTCGAVSSPMFGEDCGRDVWINTHTLRHLRSAGALQFNINTSTKKKQILKNRLQLGKRETHKLYRKNQLLSILYSN